jgi:hypothetical protein
MGTLHKGHYTFLIISCSILHKMRNVSDKSCTEKQNTHFMFNNFFLKKTLSFMRTCGKTMYRWTGHKHGACALIAGYLRLQIHNQNLQHIMVFHCNNGCTNTPQCHTYFSCCVQSGTSFLPLL